MSESEPDRVAIRFVNEINRRDLDALTALLAPDVRCVDPSGREFLGRERCREALADHLARFPEYRVSVQEHFGRGSVVALFGTATGAHSEPGEPVPTRRRSTPTAWRIVVRELHVAEWQVFGDPGPPVPHPDPARSSDVPTAGAGGGGL